MAKQFSTLRAQMSLDAQHQAKTLAETMMQEIPLHEPRQTQGLSKHVMIERLHVQPPATTMLEQRTDKKT